MPWLKKLFFAFTKKERIAFILNVALAVASFIVVASITIAQTTKTVPAPGGEYTEGMVGQPEYVNPVTASTETDESLVKMIYSNVYDIADSIQQSSDGLTWTVHLKDGLTWQDGEKLTSDDVIFTVQSIQDPNADSPLAASWQGVTVNRVSELEVQFTLASPYAFFADDLENLYIVPKHLLADVPPANWRLADYNLKPVGSGPYEFVSYGKESDGFISSYDLQAWNGYAGTQPLIQNYNFDFFANSADLVKSFNAGEVDGIGNLLPSDLSTIDRPYDLFAWTTPTYYAVFFNQSNNIALQDPTVRQALYQAVDRNALINDALGGEGTPLGTPEYGPIPQNAPYYDPSIANTSTSLELASTTLTNDGWLADPMTGQRSKTIAKANVPLVVNLTVPQIDFLVTTADDLQAAWQSIGVQVNVATDTPENIANNTIKDRSYESLLFGNVLGPSSDLYSFWDSAERFYPGLNLSIYSNSTVDSLIEGAREQLNDDARATDFTKAQDDIVAGYPAIFLYSPDYLYVTDKNVQGISPDFLPDPSDRFREVESWYLDTARVLK